jgi:hypothetical protein
MTPLEIFLQVWQQKIPVAVVEYVEAVNSGVDTDGLADVWGAVIQQSNTRTDVTLGSKPWVEETGQFLIGLFTRSGRGPAALDQAIDYVRTTFHGMAYGGLIIQQVDGPHDVDPEGVGEWWQMAMTAEYKFQTRRDATGPLYGDWENFPTTPPPPLAGP